MELALYHPSGT